MKISLDNVLDFVAKSTLEAFLCFLAFYPLYFFVLFCAYILENYAGIDDLSEIGASALLSYLLVPVFLLALFYSPLIVISLKAIKERDALFIVLTRCLMYLGFVIFYMLVTNPICEITLCYI